MFHAAHRAVRAAIGVSAIALAVASAPTVQAQKTAAGQPSAALAPNYELAAAWTAQKVSRLVFDTSVTPRWLETSDRFWYSYNTRNGRRFMFVDPVKRTRTPLFDHAKMAAALTMITRIPYDAQHLPFTQVPFIKNDAAFEFEVQVPRDAVIPTVKPKAITTEQGGAGDEQADEFDMDGNPLQQVQQQQQQREQQQQGQGQGGRGAGAAAGRGGAAPRTKTLHLEYDVATAKTTLVEDYPEDPRRPAWGAPSPDGKTILFARNHNLYMMDAANWEKAQKTPNHKAIVEHQLTTDGEEHYSFGGTSSMCASPTPGPER